jgi:RimJ/RimL family protein N-acetyltransferase
MQSDPIDGSAVENFERSVAEFPNRIAVRDGRQEITYRALNRLANQLARAILACNPGNAPIPFYLGYDITSVVAIIGIIKTGCPFVVLDPSFPVERNQLILSSLDARLLITDTGHRTQAESCMTSSPKPIFINLDDLSSRLDGENLGIGIAPEAFFRKCALNREFVKYLVLRPHENIDITRDFLNRCINCWQDGSAFPWIVVRKNDLELAGIIELRIDKFRADLGYGIAPEYWGNGYATEITKSVVGWALMQNAIYRVWATCDVENLASAHVLEKAGMQKEGILRRYILHPNISPEPRDSYCYSVIK